MSQPNVQQLLKQGIEAAREGKKTEARQLFEQVVELDEKNERGWFWLASVVESDDEKRICLKNVLQINPNNERAQKLLEQLESKQFRSRADEEVMPGITRRNLSLAIGGGMIVILVILIIFVALAGARGQEQAQQTQVARQIELEQTRAAETQAAIVAQATETQQAIVSPTPSPTNTRAFELPPTFTPTPTPEEGLGRATPLAPPPPNVGGSIIAWSGRDISQVGFLPIRQFPVAGGQPSVISADIGSHPDISPDGQRVAYTRYFSATFDFGVAQINLSGGDSRVLTQGMPINRPQMPNYCRVANRIVFVGLPTDERDTDFSDEVVRAFQVYTLDLDTGDLQRMTNDRAAYTHPAWSPDCSRIAVVRNNIRGADPGADIMILDPITRNQLPLTTDLGSFVESAPKWSPDGRTLVYAAQQATTPGSSDIVIRTVDGGGTPLVPIRDNSSNIYPVFSPDGRYIAFASNRAGAYNIFIYDQIDGTTYQLTDTQDDDYPGAWRP